MRSLKLFGQKSLDEIDCGKNRWRDALTFDARRTPVKRLLYTRRRISEARNVDLSPVVREWA
jgi:hypothetical protein